MLQTYAKETTNFSAFDPKSIMLYRPNEFTIGDFEVGWNNGSRRRTSGSSPPTIPIRPNRGEITIDGDPLTESIGQPPRWTSSPSRWRGGRYRMETLGKAGSRSWRSTGRTTKRRRSARTTTAALAENRA